MDEFSEDDLKEINFSECLATKFSVNGFRLMQKEIVELILNGHDVVAVMATGHGKSMCYQFPAVFKKGMCLVISPLISLMEAQVYTLNNSGISACFLGSAQTDANILKRVDQNEFTIIYCCPEYLQGWNGRKLLTMLKNRLTVIAIDEAHSISQWGHDFRKDYRKLTIIREIIPNVPILAVTATATEAVRQDIITMVGLNEPRVVVTTFNRPNLEYIVLQKSRYNTWNDLKRWIEGVDNGGSIIIYTLTIKETREIAVLLASHRIQSTIYHASLPMKTRSDVVQQFLKNEIKVIVATIAFGMGIDKPDIRLVIHYGASKNLESYSQEVGRAGRDGLPAKVVTFFNEFDFGVHESFLKRKLLPQSTLNHLRGLRATFRQYLYSNKCRRKAILDYFGEDTTSLAPRNDCCDNCAFGLNNKEKLFIDQPDTLSNHSLQNVQPYRSYTSMQSVVDMFFGQCVHCDHGNEYEYDEHEYDEDCGSEYDEYWGDEYDEDCGSEYDEYGSYDEAREDIDHSSSSESESECPPDENVEPSSEENVSHIVNDVEQPDTDEVVAKRRRIS